MNFQFRSSRAAALCVILIIAVAIFFGMGTYHRIVAAWGLKTWSSFFYESALAVFLTAVSLISPAAWVGILYHLPAGLVVNTCALLLGFSYAPRNGFFNLTAFFVGVFIYWTVMIALVNQGIRKRSIIFVICFAVLLAGSIRGCSNAISYFELPLEVKIESPEESARNLSVGSHVVRMACHACCRTKPQGK